jgi:ABC-type transport system involved in multi-copper enzyme maturation permease subunit
MNASPILEAAGPARRAPSGGFGVTALGALYTLTLRQHLHGKRWLVLGALFLAPSLLAALVRATAPDVPSIGLEFMFVFMLIPQALLPLVALIYGSGIIQDEQEEQTFTYLLIRPIPKGAIYAVKVFATLTTTVVLTAIFTTLTYAVIYVGADPGGENIPLRCLKAIGVHALAVVAYCCLFGFISLLTRWTLIVGFLYTFLFEVFLANMPFSIRWLTVIYYARLIAYHAMSFKFVVGKHEENMASDVWQLDAGTDKTLADHPTMGMCLAILLIGSLLCTLLGMYLCSRREFHVKTPEGN